MDSARHYHQRRGGGGHGATRWLFAPLVLVLLSSVAHAEQIPLPREKPAVDQGVLSEPQRRDAVSSFCLRALQDTGVVAQHVSAFEASGECSIEEPVAVEAVDTHTGTVTLLGRPILDCQFAAVLGAWLSEVVVPVADSLLGSPVEAVITGPGYQCRRRGDGRLSEHALGNAVDISAMRLMDGRTIPVEGLTDSNGTEREFLRAISASACGYFTTVLGPGSDAAHLQHLHLDLAERRIAEFRICMPR